MLDVLNALIIRSLRVLMAADLPSLEPEGLRTLATGVVDEAARVGEIPADADRDLYRIKLIRALSAPEGEAMYEVVPAACSCSGGGTRHRCTSDCPVDAIRIGSDGKAQIIQDRCINCGLCHDLCNSEAIVPKTAVAEYVEILRNAGTRRVYAIVAPSFAGQFGQASPRSIRLALRRIGFSDSFEVALAADIVTIKESEIYVDRMRKGRRFMITSCCCPVFVTLVEKHRPKLANLVSESVSPMVACARLVKEREPECLVVFISPCLAKRAESRDPQFARDVDLVLTFREVKNIFDVAGVDPEADFGINPGDYMDASHDGRIYAFVGGVSEAIRKAVHAVDPSLPFLGVKGNGIKECREILSELEEGICPATFMEGMGCVGGCVGGPATNRDKDEARIVAAGYAKESPTATARGNEAAHAWYEASKGLDLTARRHKEPVGV